MKTYAGNLLINLPLTWRDSSTYIFAANDADMEIRISVETATAATSPQVIIDQIQSRTALVAQQSNLRRGSPTIDGKPAHSLSFDAKTPSEPEATHSEFLVFKPDDTRCVTITGMCPAKDAQAFMLAWREMLSNLRVVAVT